MKNKLGSINSSGIALIEILVVGAIMGVIMMGMASMIQTQSRETQALSEKLAALDFQRTVMGAISVADSCKADVSAANLAPGESLEFDPATITTTDKNNPKVIAKMKRVFGTDGVTVLVDSTLANPLVSPLNQNVKLKAGTGIQLAAHRDPASGNLVYQLLLAFEQNTLVRPIHNLSLAVNPTIAPGTGANLQVTGCVGQSLSVPLAAPGTICGNRLVVCSGPAGITYDQDCGAFACHWKSTNVPCQGTTLTAACSAAPDPYGYGNTFIVGVYGCPSGWSGGHTMTNAGIAGPSAGIVETGYIFCKKD